MESVKGIGIWLKKSELSEGLLKKESNQVQWAEKVSLNVRQWVPPDTYTDM